MCIFPSFICQGGLEIMASREQGAIQHPDLSFQTILHQKDPGLCREMTDSRSGAGAAANEPEGSHLRAPEQGRARIMMATCPKDTEVYGAMGEVPPAKFGTTRTYK